MSGMEPMLISAAVGGGAAALRGGDPLQGALLGGLTGGMLDAFGAVAPVAETGASAGATGAGATGAGATGAGATGAGATGAGASAGANLEIGRAHV